MGVHGFEGLAPHDQSIVFDGAWRMLNGQRPYLDFVMPNGILPMAMQSLVFAAAGVSWTTYVAHAALLNGLYTLVVWHGLRRTGTDKLSAFIYALGAGVVLYPPIGTPYMDQHAFFFVGGAVVAVALIGARHEGRLGWMVPGLLVLGVLSKQIPTALALPAALIPIVTLPAGERRRYLKSAAIASAVAGVVVAAAVAISRIDTALVWRYAFELPGSIGNRRLDALVQEGPVELVMRVAGAFGAGGWSGAVSAMVLALSMASIAGALVAWRRSRDAAGRVLALGLISALMFLVTAGFTALTFNQPENGMALVPLAYGLVHSVLRHLTSAATDRSWRRWPVVLCGVALPVAFAAQTAAFYSNVVASRMVNDISFAGQATCGELPRELRGLRWAVPRRIGTTCAQFGDLVAYLEQAQKPTWIVGDSLILYGVIHQTSPFPAVFYHPGLTIPTEPRVRSEFEDWLLRNLARQGVSRVVIEGPFTVTGSVLGDFPRAAAVVGATECRRRSFGRFEVVDLCQPIWPISPGALLTATSAARPTRP